MILKYFIIVVVFLAVSFQLFMKYWIWIPVFIDYLKFPNTLPNQAVQWTYSAATSSNHSEPNIVVILADDLGFNDISFYFGGHDGIKTPHIDSIAHQGIAFMNGYAGRKFIAY